MPLLLPVVLFDWQPKAAVSPFRKPLASPEDRPMSPTGAAVAINLQTIERAINQINTAWNRPEQIYQPAHGPDCYMDYAQGDRLEFLHAARRSGRRR